jgi:predicted transglutaminase-like cysteine proteinase
MKHHPHLSLLLFTVFFLPALTGFGPAFAAKNSYFDMTSTQSSNLKPFPKWTGMRSRYSTQSKVSDSLCGKVRFHPCSIKQWKALLASIRSDSLSDQLKTVNDWANEHPYIEDQVNWGMEDYWETPHELIDVSGDCEDYAITKYYSLRALGISPDRLRVIIVQDLNLGGIIHAILGVYDGDELYILDNQIKQVMPAMKIYHYRPIYGVNEASWWAYYPNR